MLRKERRKVGRMVEKEQGDSPEVEVEVEKEYETQRERSQEEEEKRGPPRRRSRRKAAGSRSETHQKSRHAKCASGDQQDPNTDNPCAHHCIQGRRIQPTEPSIWCVHAEQEEHSTRNQRNEGLNSQGNDQRDVP